MEFWGLPGHLHQCILQAHYADPNDPRNLEKPGGQPGKYKVIFTLSRPGFSPLPDSEFSVADHLKGDSHLAITKPAMIDLNFPDADAINLSVATENGRFNFTGRPNRNGFLAGIELDEIEAENCKQAAVKAYHALMPTLSSFSLFFNIPLNIYQVDVTELRTNSRLFTMLMPFRNTPLTAVPFDQLSEELLRYASFYREGMNSSSPNYQFLCYFKIIEGLRKRRERLTNEAKDRGEQIQSRPRPIIPETPEDQAKWVDSLFPVRWQLDELALNSIFPSEACGRKVADVVQKELTMIRHRIAHGLLDGGEPAASIDHMPDVDEVDRWLPLTKCLSRLHIKMEFPEYFGDQSILS